MPNMDGTGPYGQGRVGKGMGPCGDGMRGNCRRGFNRQNVTVQLSKEEQKKVLEAALADLQTQKEATEAKLKSLA
jgi:hypothetical protein